MKNKLEKEKGSPYKIGGYEWYSYDDIFKKTRKKKNYPALFREEMLRLELAGQLRKFRTKRHFTQGAVAKRAAMPQSVVARAESGEHRITVGTLSRIAYALGKRIELV